MFNFNGMPRKRSGHAGGKGVSTIGMLLFLVAALLVLPSCFDDDDDDTVVKPPNCEQGTRVNDTGDGCVAIPTTPPPTVTCEDGTIREGNTCVRPDDQVREGTCEEGARHMGGDADNRINGTDGKDCIDGEKGNDIISGGGEDDDITGGPGNDTLRGGAGDDALKGDAGNDTIDGGAGDDKIVGGVGNNTLDGGDHTDTVEYSDSMRVRVNLGSGFATNVVMATDPNSFDPPGGTDTLANIENVAGSSGPDMIDGDNNANRLEGWDGADTINGHGGDDTIVPNRPMPPAAGEAADATDTVDGGMGSDTISYEGEATGSGVTIDLSATQAPGFIEEMVDADLSDGDSSAPAHFTATIGSVVDRIAVVNVNMGTEMGPKFVSTIENITGGAGSDYLTGDARDNVLMGGGGEDVLNGDAGNDELNGGDDNEVDTLNGGPGNDTIHGGVDATGNSNDTIDGGEGPMMAEMDDMTTLGVDESSVDIGVDVVSFAHIDEDTNTTTDGDQGVTVTFANFTSVEQVIGSPLADMITGSSGRDMIVGGDGDDTLSGGGGGTGTGDDFSKATADVLVGAGGDDTLNGTDGSVEVFAVHVNEGGGDDMITAFTLREDHLHFVAAAVTHTCARGAMDNTVICTLSTGQTVTIGYTGTLADPLDLDSDLNIVNDPNAG